MGWAGKTPGGDGGQDPGQHPGRRWSGPLREAIAAKDRARLPSTSAG
ncbi:hypothetical protein ACRAWD_15285 [Caulobacter segnis]